MKDSYVIQAQMNFNTECTELMKTFFSDANLDVIQSGLQKQVRTRTGQSISKQSCGEIFVLMKYVYTNHGLNVEQNISNEVFKLNSLVLKELVPMVISNVLQYLQYIKDINTQPVPLEYGQSSGLKGANKSYELPPPF